MKKQVLLTLFAVAIMATACTQKKEYKKALGTNMLWADEVGFFASSASVFEENGTTYYIYEANKNKNEETVYFAMRSSTGDLSDASYSKAKIILEPSASGWDRYINSPSVVKGEFKKDGKTYNYIMTYGGRKSERDLANQVGLAYAESLEGPWTKLEKPIIKYDAEESGDEYGAGAPSMVSYDKKGKVRLFYSYAETNLCNEKVIDCDFSDLDHIVMDAGGRHISVNGLRDNADNVIFSNADFAIDSENNLYVVRDVYPLSYNTPGHATSIQTAKADARILNDFVNYEWDVRNTLNTSMTVDFEDDDSMGWDEIYSPAFVTDAYGHIPEGSDKLVIVYSTAVEPEERSDTTYKWSPCLAYHEVNL